MVPTLVAVTVGAALAVATVWCAIEVREREARPLVRWAWWLALIAAVTTASWTPRVNFAAQGSREIYKGEDLLLEERPETRELHSAWRIPGILRTGLYRTTQAGDLLHDERRVELMVPLGLVALLLAWGWRRGRIRNRVPGRAAAVAALGLAGLLGGCDSGASPKVELAETRMVELLEMRRSGDVTGLVDLFHPGGVYDDHPNQVQYQGVQEVAAYLLGLHEWASGIFIDVAHIHAGSDWAVAEWALEGVQSGPMPGVADSATFRRFRQEGVTVLELEQGLIVRAADYADMVPVLLDLGGAVRFPSGDSLTRPPPRP